MYYKEWRKNPQWSFSCSLALLLPLDVLQGEVCGMVGDNLLKTQLDTGKMDTETVDCILCEDSGALSFTLCGEDVEGGHKIRLNGKSRPKH